MESSDLLLTVSQLAIGLAGFSAIIVSLNSRPIREWDETDRLNLRLLIQVSFVALFFSLLPFLLAVSLESERVWFYGLWIYGVIHLVDVSTFLFRMTADSAALFRVSGFVGLVIAVSQVAVAALGAPSMQETLYVGTLVWHLYVVFMAFVLLLYQLRKSNSDSNQ